MSDGVSNLSLSIHHLHRSNKYCSSVCLQAYVYLGKLKKRYQRDRETGLSSRYLGN